MQGRLQLLNRFKALNCVLLSLAVLFPCSAAGHSSLIASYTVKREQTTWKMYINFPLYSLHKVLLRKHTEAELRDEKGNYNVETAINYLKSTTRIEVNDGKNVRLAIASYSLSDHQSQFAFILEDIPERVDTFKFHISAMSENPGHTNIARVILDHENQNKKVVLNRKNRFQGEIKL